MRYKKTKSNRWVESYLKMRNLHRCHCLQKFSKYEKINTYRLGSNGVPFSIQRVKEFAIEKNKTGQIKCTYLYSMINTLNLSIILRFPEKSFISLRTPFHFKKCKQCLTRLPRCNSNPTDYYSRVHY